jgi:hypothetical protein
VIFLALILVAIRMAELPQSIFKYVGPDRIDIIKNLRIRFTQPSCCNDPFEAQLCVGGLDDPELMKERVENLKLADYRRHVVHKHCSGGRAVSFEKFKQTTERYYESALLDVKANPRAAQERAAESVRKFWDDLGILSLTETDNNLLMWSHYTKDHKGMVIELDRRHPFLKPIEKSQPDGEGDIQFGALTPVVYSSDRPRHRLGESPRPSDFFTKSPDWNYEREWRVIRLLSERIEQIGPVHLFALPPECIKGVVMGCCMEQKTRSDLLNGIAANPALRHVQIAAARMDPDVFHLNYRATNHNTPLR